ncbi:uncharacterized protein B0P05DRAFT_529838, partial [Gilbertella persicaria]|uniref:uncharacterized protein n=1 Tax=Gilbertella persicaria TaxID=101096 RepID=UPI00221E4087
MKSDIAILQVKNEENEYNLAASDISSSNNSSSNRSSMSSLDTTPLELGIVINALQHAIDDDATIIQQEQDHEQKKIEQDTSSGSANVIKISPIDPKHIKPNTLNPREQEKADEHYLKAIHLLFSNKFMKAKQMFEQYAHTDPFYTSGLGSMTFFKAIMTMDQGSIENAMQVLMSTYTIASAQIHNTTGPFIGSKLISYVTSYCHAIKISRGSALPTNVMPVKPKKLELHKTHRTPNGVLRAHVVKAEACLQMAILYLFQETIAGYIKCGLNLRRAYTSYTIVWQEYKRMGQLHDEYIDRDTISGIQFGIGSIHLVLSSLPSKILRTVAAFGWKADQHLGFALLKLCLENKRAKSPMASAMLLAYYTTLTNLCPQLLVDEYTQPAIHTLLDAQKTYPNSTIFLYFAGRTSRIARNLTLSTQSFLYAIETSKNEWVEVQMNQMASYEIGLNYMMQSDWEEAAGIFDALYKEGYWSPAILRYLTGACLDMMGRRTEAILAFAQIPGLITRTSKFSNNTTTSGMEHYILHKVEFFQTTGYQDMDMTMCALEYLYLCNAFEFMDTMQLEHNLHLTEDALGRILDTEKLEYSIRARELLPETPPPQYDPQRAILLLIKAAILNAMGRVHESIIHLNWVIDHKDTMTADSWVLPFAYWEVGTTCWNLNHKTRAKEFWKTASRFTGYNFEYKLATRVYLAVTQAEKLGIVQRLDKVKSNDKTNDTSMPIKYRLSTSESKDMEHIVQQLRL